MPLKDSSRPAILPQFVWRAGVKQKKAIRNEFKEVSETLQTQVHNDSLSLSLCILLSQIGEEKKLRLPPLFHPTSFACVQRAPPTTTTYLPTSLSLSCTGGVFFQPKPPRALHSLHSIFRPTQSSLLPHCWGRG